MAYLIATGASYRDIYGIGATGSETAFGVGPWYPNFAVYGTVNAFFGALDGGLFVSHVRLGGLVEGGIPRLRFGGGIQLGVLTIPRASMSGTLWGITVGFTTHARADLFVWDGGALFLEARSSLSYNPVMMGGEGYLGLRL